MMGRARLLTGQLVPATLQSQSAESSSESAEPAFRDSGSEQIAISAHPVTSNW